MPNKLPNRKLIRLKGYDYSQKGLYFITICTQNSKYLFGEINQGKIISNIAGEMTAKWWVKLAEKFEEVKLHEFVVMPNHIHGIIEISKDYEEEDQRQGENGVSPVRLQGIGRYISWFKRMSSNEYIRLVKEGALPPFHKRVWQRNYYDNVIRDKKAFDNISAYIKNNPHKWEKDKFSN